MEESEIGGSPVVRAGGELTSDPTLRGVIVGSWLATVTDGVDPSVRSFAMLLTFAPGGVLIESDQRQVGEVGEKAHLTGGHGSWASLGEGQFRAQFTKFGGRPQRQQFAVIRHDITITVDSAGNTLTGDGTLQVSAASSGDVLGETPVRIAGKRLG